MARARNLKPALFMNEDLGTRDPLLTILFAGLWCLADREGRLEDRPLRIKAEIFPYREKLDVNVYLTELYTLGLIQRYRVGDLALIQVTNFKKHQNPHKTEKDSIYPALSEGCLLTVNNTLNNGSRPADSLLPLTDSLLPLTDSGFPPTSQKSSPRNKRVSTEEINGVETAAVWQAYSEAYAVRYAVEPVRNAKVNGQIKQLVKRLGIDDAPEVARFFLTHNGAYYVQRAHSVDCLLSDAEKLRTEWATGRKITVTGARQADRTQQNKNVLEKLLEDNANGKL